MQQAAVGLCLVLGGCTGSVADGGEAGSTPPIHGDPAATPVAQSLMRVSDCSEAERIIRQRALDQMNVRIDALLKAPASAQPNRCWAASAPAPGAPSSAGSSTPLPVPAASAPASSNGAQASTTATGAMATSTTNNQVAGVDEADFIKNDDKYIYTALNGALRIIAAWPAADSHEIANVKLDGEPKKLFVIDDRALVYVSVPQPSVSTSATTLPRVSYARSSECTYGYDCQFGGDGTATALLVFDIGDRSHPALIRRLELNGSLVAARRIDHAVHTVVVTPEIAFPGISYSPALNNGGCGPTPTQAQYATEYERLRTQNTKIIMETALPAFAPTVREGDTSYGSNACDTVYRESTPSGAAFTTLVSIDMVAGGAPKIATVVSKPGAVYASDRSLYMAVTQTDSLSSAASSVHKFRVTARPDDTAYLASGAVPGRVLNQFSMDEYAEHLRIATTTGRVPDPNVHSTLSILAQRAAALAVVGEVDNIAPSEDIRSVRFDGEHGFVVTFKKTDPLYVFDLANPTAPKIAGELQIPGFSTYMHMLDATHLLTIGYDADDHGTFAFFNGILLQIFDVTEPTAPALLHKTVIGTRGSSSEALTDHLAFNLFGNKLAVPMTICEGGGDGTYGTDLTFSGLIVYDVSLERGIIERGRVAHPTTTTGGYDNANCRNWWTNATSNVERSIFMDDFVYSVARDVIRVQNLNAMGTDAAAVRLSP